MRTMILGLMALIFTGCGAAQSVKKMQAPEVAPCDASKRARADRACYFAQRHRTAHVVDIFVIAPAGVRVPDTEWRSQEEGLARLYLGQTEVVTRPSNGLPYAELQRHGAQQGLMRRWKVRGQRGLAVCPQPGMYPGWTCLTSEAAKVLKAFPTPDPRHKRWSFAVVSSSLAEGKNAIERLLPERVGSIRLAWNCTFSSGERAQPMHPNSRTVRATLVGASCITH